MRLCIIHDCILNRVKIQSDRGAFSVGLSHNNLVLSTELIIDCEYYIMYENHSMWTVDLEKNMGVIFTVMNTT